ncbi:MAG: pseudouridine synthase [Blautia sp.]
MCTTDKRLGRSDRRGADSLSEKGLYMGRLDKDSEGLLLMTNNGEILNKMMRAGNYHEKEYLVRVNRTVMHGSFPERNGKRRHPGAGAADKTLQEWKKTGERTFRIILTQGLNQSDPQNV